MKLRSFGYVGQNLTTGRTTGRTLRLANLSPERVAEVIGANLAGLAAILEWNLEREIRFFRIGSSVIPFASHPGFELDWQERFRDELSTIREFAERHEVRLSMHPGQYTVLNSAREQVVENSLRELEYHARFLESVAPDVGTVTLHLGGAYGDKEEALRRFVDNFARLSPSAQQRLTLENDDTSYDIDEVLLLCGMLDRPAVFDFFHHRCLHRRPHWRDDLPTLLESVISSWRGSRPKFHLSSPREEGRTAHADYVSRDDLLETLAVLQRQGGDGTFDLMLEAKQKDRAVLEAVELLGARM